MKKILLLLVLPFILLFSTWAQDENREASIPSHYFLNFSEKEFLSYCKDFGISYEKSKTNDKLVFYLIKANDTSYVRALGILFNKKKRCTNAAVTYDYEFLKIAMLELNSIGINVNRYTWVLDSKLEGDIKIIAQLEYFANYFRITYTLPALDK